MNKMLKSILHVKQYKLYRIQLKLLFNIKLHKNYAWKHYLTKIILVIIIMQIKDILYK